jgi:hypothetical protein
MVCTRILARLALLLAILLGSVSASLADMIVRGHTSGNDPKYDRFENSSEFIGAGLNFSGVGQDTTSAKHWLTMISPHFFLSAGHYQPSGSAVFYNTNSLTGGSHQYSVLGGQQISGIPYPTDLYVGIIDGSVTNDGIAYYPIVDSDEITVGQSLLVYGKPNRLGINTISSTGNYYLSDSGGNTISRTQGYRFDYPESGYDGEAQLVVGDSGGPTFVQYGSLLALAGTHSGASQSAYPYMSQDSSPAFYIDAINAAMASLAVTYGIGAGEQLTVVPEPSSLILLCIAAVGLLAYSRRRRAS